MHTNNTNLIKAKHFMESILAKDYILKPIVWCEICGAMKFIRPVHIKKYKKHFCSRYCFSQSLKGKPTWNKGITGKQIAWNKGKRFSDEVRKKISIGHIGQQAWNKGKKTPIIVRKKLSLAHINPSIQKRMNMSIAHIGKKLPEQQKRKIKQYWTLEKRLEASIRSSKNQYKFKDTKPEKMVQLMLTINGIRFEKQKLFKIGNKYHRVDIFIEPNICIEVDGEYWHDLAKNAQRDIKINQTLNEQGYHVIRIRSRTIMKNNNSIVAKILNLLNGVREVKKIEFR